jgi:cysteinyl-tRNA synthetase
MDLMFPHHENELAQSESATGKQFVKYWMHNGLTRMPTKLPGGQIKLEKQSKSLGNTIDARTLIESTGADAVRYLLLGTHYRSPIDFTDQTMANVKKALLVFTRVFERVERLGIKLDPAAPDMETSAANHLPSENEHFVRSVINYKMKFLEMMDDDFNTAGAIGVMHELAGEINAFIEQNKLEQTPQPEVTKIAAAAAQTLKKMGMLLGFFRDLPKPAAADAAQSGLAEDLMQLIIQLRAEARKKKDFATADAIRDGLAKLKITLEDRAGGTSWRRD